MEEASMRNFVSNIIFVTFFSEFLLSQGCGRNEIQSGLFSKAE